MNDFGIKGWNHSCSEINNEEHLMNFNINYHFADFEENDKLFDRNFSMERQINIYSNICTYLQIFVPRYKYLDLGTNDLYLGTTHLYLGLNIWT